MRAPVLLWLALAAGCSNLLDVDYPGRIPSEQLEDPNLAGMLVRSAVGDFECAYNNYTGGTAVHSDEFETAGPASQGSVWGLRQVDANLVDYVTAGCEATTGQSSTFALHRPLQTARFQAEDISERLQGWSDAQVTGRTALLATVRTYNAYAYTLFGETFCSVAFDGGAEQTPAAVRAIAEQRFTEALALAQQANDQDLLNLARVGAARVKRDLGKWAEAAQLAAQVAAGYEKVASRGTETDRRWNKVFYHTNQQRNFTVGAAYRSMNDPRVAVVDAGRPTVNPNVALWVTTKYTALGNPIRLASYREAQLLQAEALAEQEQVGPAVAIVNARRAGLGLANLTAADRTSAVVAIVEERRRELAFEGGHRLYDLLRKGTPWKQGANPFSGQPYGTTTCWPFPTNERNGA